MVDWRNYILSAWPEDQQVLEKLKCTLIQAHSALHNSLDYCCTPVEWVTFIFFNRCFIYAIQRTQYRNHLHSGKKRVAYLIVSHLCCYK